MTKRYWIAINGSSCAMSVMPWDDPVTIPVAEQMFGFPTLKEARQAQKICLTKSIPDVYAWMKSLEPDVQAGRIIYKRPDNPEAPRAEATVWMEAETELGGFFPCERHGESPKTISRHPVHGARLTLRIHVISQSKIGLAKIIRHFQVLYASKNMSMLFAESEAIGPLPGLPIGRTTH